MDTLPANKALNTIMTILFTFAFIGNLFAVPGAWLLIAAAAGVLLFLVRIAKGYD